MIALDQAGLALKAAPPTGSGPPGTAVVPVAPPGELDRWVVEGWEDRASGSGWRIVADDSPYLIYSERAGPRGARHRLAVVGPRSRPLDVDRSDRRVTAAVRLRPGSLGPLFRTDAHALMDRSADPAALLGSRVAGGWLDRVAGARGTGRVPALFALVAGIVPSAPEAVDWRVRGILAGESRRPPLLGARCRELGVSPRSLRDVFQREVGLAPSVTLRIRRLHGALLEGLRGPAPVGGWAAVAARHGYADQSHLIRDCRAVVGESPEVFRRRADSFNPGPEE